MKGFGIEIKNNLLEPKHIDKMGVSVWLYMWFIDKITFINEKGLGIVLGGKPIIYEEVFEELGIAERTYSRWLQLLKKNGYILITRTPKGLTIKVTKAFKRFGKRYAKSGVSDMPKVAYRPVKSGVSNKDTAVDSTSDQVKFWKQKLQALKQVKPK